MTKKMPLAVALVAGLAMAAPATADACSACGHRTHFTSSVTWARPVQVVQPQFQFTSNVCAPAPVCRPVVCRPVCDPCDPCRRSGLFGWGFLGIL